MFLLCNKPVTSKSLKVMKTPKSEIPVIIPFFDEVKKYQEYFNLKEYRNSYIVWEDPKNLEFINTIYWKLDVISCVLVLRNKYWFKKIQPLIECFWDNLIEERETGKYKERIPKKRKLASEEYKNKSNLPKKSGCLIDASLFNK